MNATTWEIFAAFWVDDVETDWEADLLIWEGGFEVWLGVEYEVEPMTDFATFFGPKPELLLTTVDGAGTGLTLDLLESEVMERCCLLPESVVVPSTFISEWLGSGREVAVVAEVVVVTVVTEAVVVTLVVVVTPSLSDGIPKSSLGTAWRADTPVAWLFRVGLNVC